MAKLIQIRVSSDLEKYLTERAEREYRSVPNLVVSLLMKEMAGAVPNRVPVYTPPAEKPRVIGGYTDEEFAELL